MYTYIVLYLTITTKCLLCINDLIQKQISILHTHIYTMENETPHSNAPQTFGNEPGAYIYISVFSPFQRAQPYTHTYIYIYTRERARALHPRHLTRRMHMNGSHSLSLSLSPSRAYNTHRRAFLRNPSIYCKIRLLRALSLMWIHR